MASTGSRHGEAAPAADRGAEGTTSVKAEHGRKARDAQSAVRDMRRNSSRNTDTGPAQSVAKE